MRPVTVTTPTAAGTVLVANSSGASAPIVMDYHMAPFVTGVAVEYPTGVTATCTVEISLDDPFAASFGTAAVWFAPSTTLSAVTGPTLGTIANSNGAPIACRAVRLNNTSFSAGTTGPSLTIVMAGGIA